MSTKSKAQVEREKGVLSLLLFVLPDGTVTTRREEAIKAMQEYARDNKNGH